LGNARNLAFWVVLFVLVISLFNLFGNGQGATQTNEKSYSEFVQAVEAGAVVDARIDGEKLYYRGSDNRTNSTTLPPDVEVTNLLLDNGVTLTAESQTQSGLTTFLVSLLPFLLLIGVWIYFMNRMQGGGKGGAMGFGKSKAKMLTEKSGRVTFDDVAGIDEAKEELEEIVEFLRNPQKFSRLGGKIPKGALLVGPPGTGKTLQVCRSLRFPVLTSLKCLSVSVHPVCATCSSKPRKTRPASFLSTRLTPLVAHVVLAWAVVMTNVNRH
jgi:cell division protease FtsH